MTQSLSNFPHQERLEKCKKVVRNDEKTIAFCLFRWFCGYGIVPYSFHNFCYSSSIFIILFRRLNFIYYSEKRFLESSPRRYSLREEVVFTGSIMDARALRLCVEVTEIWKHEIVSISLPLERFIFLSSFGDHSYVTLIHVKGREKNTAIYHIIKRSLYRWFFFQSAPKKTKRPCI